MIIPGKYLIFLGNAANRLDAKTGSGLVDWRPEICAGQWRLPACGVDLDLPDLSPAEAIAAGARTLVIGVAPFGGGFAPEWIEAVVEALEAGLDVASGLHARLGSVPEIAAAAERTGGRLYDARHAEQAFAVGSGRRRSGRRLLAVGTDCAVGKKYTALAITRDMQRAGMQATFRATGQTGILLAGRGVAIDAVVADFIAGAAEWLSPDNAADHWDVIEGQGSLFHPAYAGVSTGLLHGSQPDALVLCHEVGRTHIDGYPDHPLPDMQRCIDLNLMLARITNPDVRWAGISLNTRGLDQHERETLLAATSHQFGVPCFDPVATGADALVEHLRREFADTAA